MGGLMDSLLSATTMHGWLQIVWAVFHHSSIIKHAQIDIITEWRQPLVSKPQSDMKALYDQNSLSYIE